MTRWNVLKDNIIGLIVTCILSTVIVMGVTGVVAQFIISLQKKKGDKNNE